MSIEGYEIKLKKIINSNTDIDDKKTKAHDTILALLNFLGLYEIYDLYQQILLEEAEYE